MRCRLGNDGLFQLVDGVVVGALKNRFHDNVFLGGVEFFDQGFRGFGNLAADRIPEHHFDGFLRVRFRLFAAAAANGAEYE